MARDAATTKGNAMSDATEVIEETGGRLSWSISPEEASVEPGQMLQFQVERGPAQVKWRVVPADGYAGETGSIDSDTGLYTAPEVLGETDAESSERGASVVVEAHGAAPGDTARAVVKLVPDSSPWEIVPAKVTIAAGEEYGFAQKPVLDGVEWSVTAAPGYGGEVGFIDSHGFYRAPGFVGEAESDASGPGASVVVEAQVAARGKRVRALVHLVQEHGTSEGE
ncbi:hypothetical protein [Streptomyces sp. NPDC002467]|uniref:hypothetical protein n=1 Tax=Streptomyces sp. NPDC002467 TaxID=3364647 RepID=UPI0036B72151